MVIKTHAGMGLNYYVERSHVSFEHESIKIQDSFEHSTRRVKRTFRTFRYTMAVIRFQSSLVMFHTLSTGAAFLASTRLSMQSYRTMALSSSSASAELSKVPTEPPLSLPDITNTDTKRLFLVRHGEVVNPGGSVPVYYGAMDVPLSFLGQKEAVAAAKYLMQYDLAAVFTSPLSRAYYGAEQVMTRQDNAIGPIKLKGFKELERGSWRGKTKEQIGMDKLAAFDAGDLNATPSGGESYEDLNQRVMAALDEVMDIVQPGEAGAIVSHLQVTRCILAAALGLSLDQLTNLKIATASITCIDYVSTVVPQQIVHFQSFKPDTGLTKSSDGAN